MSLYSYNDWRDYLQHSWGTSPKMKEAEKKYNAKYYQEHKEEILKKRQEARRNSYEDKEGEESGWDYESHDGKKSRWDSEEYGNGDDAKKKAELLRLANDDAFTDSLTEYDVLNDAEDNLKNSKDYPPDVLENIKKNNDSVRSNVENLMKTVQDYVKKNGDNLSSDQIAKLYKDMDNQVALEMKRVIDVGSKEGKAYVNGLTGNKSSSSSSKSSSSAQNKLQTDSGTGTASTKTSTPKKSNAGTSVAKTDSKTGTSSSSTSEKQAMKDTVDFYKGNKSAINDENGAAQDLGEFLAEYMENGGSDLSGQKAVNEWKKFRKELGLETSDKKVENSARDLGRRQTAYQQEERKKR